MLKTKKTSKHITKFETRFAKPKVKWQKRVKVFIYNKEKKAVLGRTASSWGKICLFFVCFYGVLFLGSTLMFLFFYEYLIPKLEPKLQDLHNLLNGTPGISVIPLDPDGPVHFKLSDIHTAALYIKNLENNIKKNFAIKDGENVVNCSTQVKNNDQVCKLEKSVFFPDNLSCTKENNFGFADGKPCFIVKINKLFNWKPQAYGNWAEVPSKYPRKRFDWQSIGILCHGLSSADADNVGNINYVPPKGIPFKYFPYKNQKNYAAPFTWIQLTSIRLHVLVCIRCQAFVKNMNIYHRHDISYVDFYVLID